MTKINLDNKETNVRQIMASDIKEKALIKRPWLLEKRGDLPLVFSPLLKEYPKLVHAFSTRQGGNSKPPFDSFNIGINHSTDEGTRQDARHNKAVLCQSLNIPFGHLTTAKRLVHSADVVMLETVGEPGEIDGIATKSMLGPLYMTFADCVPVVIYDPNNHIVCLVHAGWRGTASGISREAVRFVVEECGSKAGDLVCAIGPAIDSCCYPVGLDVVIKLMLSLTDNSELEEMSRAAEYTLDKVWLLIEKLNLEGFFKRGDPQIHVDLKAINAYQMLALNVSGVDITDLCTSCKPDLFYSYRRSSVTKEGNTGRQGAIVCLL